MPLAVGNALMGNEFAAAYAVIDFSSYRIGRQQTTQKDFSFARHRVKNSLAGIVAIDMRKLYRTANVFYSVHYDIFLRSSKISMNIDRRVLHLMNLAKRAVLS
ncbi:hypothetical protein [Pararobbsia silviterrae]|uniref:hypothetical protein n=1 Tax=Pararobbsia silviterrae TaxID=1792498 RepID=UPI0011C3C67F|nr:hypothetical protein [Pararobbsia silviterrae]